MAILDLNALLSLAQLTPRKRLAGLDVGEKTIGISVCDALWRIATPVKTMSVQPFAPAKKRYRAVQELLDFIKEYDIVAFVVGLPLNMNGSFGPQAQKVQQFIEELTPLLPADFCFWDERLSTMAVTRTLLEADMSRKKRKEVVDKLAASFILQGALDYLKNSVPPPSTETI